MKNCPDCNMEVNDEVEVCPACLYSFKENKSYDQDAEVSQGVETVAKALDEASNETQEEAVMQTVSEEAEGSEEPEIKVSCVCVKCGKPLERPTSVCECGGYAKNAIEPGGHLNEKELGIIGWIMSVLLSPLALVIGFIMPKRGVETEKGVIMQRRLKYKQMISISIMCMIVYASFVGFYFLSQFLSTFLIPE
ncbi:MAG: hypothetical protein K6G26_08455 [Lachnospiraceae bacterium]|nr:hypothetical protein [Lachnospiraceae bacterium]